MATLVNKTIGTASRDYSTFALWDNGEDRNLISDDEIARATVYNDSVFGSGCVISGWATDAGHYIEILVAQGEKHDGTDGTGARIVDTGATIVAAFNIREDYVRIQDMAIKTGSSEHGNYYAIWVQDTHISSPSDIRISYLFIDGESDSSGNGMEFNDGSATLKIWNNIVMRCTSHPGIVFGDCDNAYVYNNTCYGNDYGITRTSGTVIAINNACFDNISGQFSGTFDPSSGYNASSAADCPGSNNQESKTAADNFVSTGSGTEDFNVKNGSADIYAAGFDLSGDTYIPIVDDVINYTRSSRDIGAFEFQAGSSSRALIVAKKLYSIHKFGLFQITAECKIRDVISDFGDKATFKIGNTAQTFDKCIVTNVKRSLVDPKRVTITTITGGYLYDEDEAWT